MELKSIEYKLTVCKVADISEIEWMADFYFVGKTDEEISLVCKTEDTPDKTTERDDGMTDGEAFAFREFWIFH